MTESVYLRQVNFYRILILRGLVWTIPGNMHKALIVLELLAFNAEKFVGSRHPGHAPFQKNLTGPDRTVRGNMRVKSEVRSFNRYGAISI